MSHTRAELDDKLTRLEARARTLTPRQLSKRYLPEYFTDRAIGGILLVSGAALAWSRRRKQRQRREGLRLATAGCW